MSAAGRPDTVPVAQCLAYVFLVSWLISVVLAEVFILVSWVVSRAFLVVHLAAS
jgi:hypothetical protein